MHFSCRYTIIKLIAHFNWNYKCTVDTFKSYKGKNWDKISAFPELLPTFIEEFEDKVNWFNISRYQVLSETFIERYQNKVNWANICQYQVLSEEFIRKFSKNIAWTFLLPNQKLSDDFIMEFKDVIFDCFPYLKYADEQLFNKINNIISPKHNYFFDIVLD